MLLNMGLRGVNSMLCGLLAVPMGKMCLMRRLFMLIALMMFEASLWC